jgi:hypothetical protein
MALSQILIQLHEADWLSINSIFKMFSVTVLILKNVFYPWMVITTHHQR